MATRSGDGRETERVLRLYEKEARKYDREMNFFDPLLFAGAREWVCAQATGEVLEIGIGTGRNLPHYRHDVRLTGVELSPAMLEIARARARELGRDVDLRVGDMRKRSSSATTRSTPSCARCRCARFPTTELPSPRCDGCYVPAAACCYSNMCAARSYRFAWRNDCSTRWPFGSRRTTCFVSRSTTCAPRGSRWSGSSARSLASWSASPRGSRSPPRERQ